MNPINFESPCPYCGHGIAFTVTQTAVTTQHTEPRPSWLDQQSPEDKALIKKMTDTGLLKAFEDVVQTWKNPPNNIPKYLLTFLRVAKPPKLAPAQRFLIHQEFPFGRRVELLQHQNVLAVIVDGEPSMFLPYDILKPDVLGSDAQKVSVSALGEAQKQINDWRKSKHGYIPAGCGEFFDSLRKRSFGEFDR